MNGVLRKCSEVQIFQNDVTNKSHIYEEHKRSLISHCSDYVYHCRLGCDDCSLVGIYQRLGIIYFLNFCLKLKVTVVL